MNAFLHRHRDKVLLACALLLVFTIAVSAANKTLQPQGYAALFVPLGLVLLSLVIGDGFLRLWFGAVRVSKTIDGAIILITLVASGVAGLVALVVALLK